MLPIFQTTDKDLSLLQTKWASQLNPLLSSPLSNGRIINSIALQSGANTINHGLGRPLQGWIVTRLNANESIWEASLSDNPSLTLLLNTSGACTASLYVF